MTDPNLWKAIEAFELDAPSAALTFSQRLARDNHWSHAFALQVVGEYKRFIYLAMVSDGVVTPSEEVDAAWHLHLCYTRSYWDDLCSRVLKRPLHHNPTQGGTEQRAFFLERYEHTLAEYESEFGIAPPAEIWPPSAQRFAPLHRLELVDANQFIILNRRYAQLGIAAAFCVAATLFLAGCSLDDIDDDKATIGLISLVFVAIAISSLWKTLSGSKRGRKDDRNNDSGGCSSSGDDSGCGSACGSGCGGGCGGCGGD